MKKAAGLLLFRKVSSYVEVFLVHPGGPFWKNKDAGAWSIPKGEFTEQEDPLDAAIREFAEETGSPIAGDFIPLTPIKQKSGKIVYAWAVEADLDPATIVSNTFTMEWPPRSGRQIEVAEVDRGEWFTLKNAGDKINPAQAALLNELTEKIKR